MKELPFYKIEIGQKFWYNGNKLIRTHVDDDKGGYLCVDVDTGDTYWLSMINTFVIPV